MRIMSPSPFWLGRRPGRLGPPAIQSVCVVAAPHAGRQNAPRGAGPIACSLRRLAAAARTRPTIGERVIGLLGVDPVFPTGVFDLLPERRAGLEKIHQEL